MPDFSKNSRNKDGLQDWCKSCIHLNYAKTKAQNPEKFRKSREMVDKAKIWRLNNKEKIRETTAKYFNNEQNKQRAKARRNAYYTAKLKTDLFYKLGKNLRIGLNKALKNGAKTGSAVKDLGCSIEFLKQYLESKFQPGMTWDNWGRASTTKLTWQIDHIIPTSSFNLIDRQELLKACHYTNLQPMWAIENIKKSNKVY